LAGDTIKDAQLVQDISHNFLPVGALGKLPGWIKGILAALGIVSTAKAGVEMVTGTGMSVSLRDLSVTTYELSNRERIARGAQLLSAALVTAAINAESIPTVKGRLRVEPSKGKPYTQSELRSAEYMKDLGFEVTLRPPGKVRGKDTSDLLVTDKRPLKDAKVQYDVYTPETNKPDRIAGAAAKKSDQAESILIDLSETKVKPEQLGGDIKNRLNKATTSGSFRNVLVTNTRE
jgi:hypothetical protein